MRRGRHARPPRARGLLPAALTAGVVGVAWLGLTGSSAPASPGSGPDAALRHHSAMRHAGQVRHAEHVRAARRHWWLRELTVHGNYRFDMVTTRTGDWACIRLLEDGVRRWDDPAQYHVNASGAYGDMRSGGQAIPVAQLDAGALAILHQTRGVFSAYWSTATACGLR